MLKNTDPDVKTRFVTLFMLVPFGLLSGKQEQYPSVWVCACTKGCRKVYEKKSSSWSAVMDHLAIAHGIAVDAKHPSIVSKQAAQARQDRKQRALDAGMTEARFEVICTTRYIIRTSTEMLGVGHGLLLVPPPGSFLQMYAWCDVFA